MCKEQAFLFTKCGVKNDIGLSGFQPGDGG